MGRQVKHRLLVLTPARGNTVSGPYSDTIARLAMECDRAGVEMLTPLRNNVPGLLDHARCVLYGETLDSTATHSLWLDADSAFLPGAVVPLLDRPELERDCITRVYRSRDGAASTENIRKVYARIQDHGRDITRDAIWNTLHEFGVRPWLKDGRLQWSPDRKLLLMAHVGFGFVLMRNDTMRAFAEQMRAAGRVAEEAMRGRVHPDTLALAGIDCKPIGKDWGGRKLVRAFGMASHVECRHGGHGNGQPGEEARIAGGEDVCFWQRWCAAGREIWCAPEAYLSNGGIGGVYLDHLREFYPDSFTHDTEPAPAGMEVSQ